MLFIGPGHNRDSAVIEPHTEILHLRPVGDLYPDSRRDQRTKELPRAAKNEVQKKSCPLIPGFLEDHACAMCSAYSLAGHHPCDIASESPSGVWGTAKMYITVEKFQLQFFRFSINEE